MQFRLPYGNIISAIPDVVLGLAFLATWIEPTALGDNMFQYLSLVVMLEFFIIHSSAFMGFVMFRKSGKPKKVIYLLLLGLFYTMFIAIFSAGSNTSWPVVSFWCLMLNRLLSVLIGEADTGTEFGMLLLTWFFGGFFYVGGIFLINFLPLPTLGLTSEVIHQLKINPHGTLWLETPQAVLAFGFFYYTAIGIIEIVASGWFTKNAGKALLSFGEIKTK